MIKIFIFGIVFVFCLLIFVFVVGEEGENVMINLFEVVILEEGFVVWDCVYEVVFYLCCVNCYMGESDCLMWLGLVYGKICVYGMNICVGESWIGVEFLFCLICYVYCEDGNDVLYMVL